MKKFHLIFSAFLMVTFLSGCASSTYTASKSVNWETVEIDEADFIDYLDSNMESLDPIEGIWVDENQNYRIAIKRDKSNRSREFIGFVIETSVIGWKKGHKKIDISSTAQPGIYMLKYYDGAFAQSRATVVIKGSAIISFRIARGTNYEGTATYIKTHPKIGSNVSQNGNSSKAFGSGFYVTSNGYLLTNQHVVEGASQVIVYSENQQLPAKVVKTDKANDLALLKVVGKFNPLPVSSSRSVKLGQTVSTVGFPRPNLQGKLPKLTKGEISSLSGASDDPKYFQISVPVQPGNSGGPLVDAYGNVVGVVTAKLRASAALETSGTLPENVNYAIKGTFVMGFLESVPDVAAAMLDSKAKTKREFTEVVREAEKASVMILVNK